MRTLRALLNRLAATFTVAALVAGLFAFLTMKLTTTLEVADARRDYRTALTARASAAESRRSLEARLAELGRNSKAVEVAIRTQFRMIRPGERVAHIENAVEPK